MALNFTAYGFRRSGNHDHQSTVGQKSFSVYSSKERLRSMYVCDEYMAEAWLT